MMEGNGGGALPRGTVTFLLTDIEGSTRLWEHYPEEMRASVARHDQIVAAAVEDNAGTVVKARGEGDSAFAVFARATDAVAGALELQRTLTAEPWPSGVHLRVRAAVHTGEADLREEDYYGATVNRCARLRAIAHGGQTLVSEVTAGITLRHLPGAEVELVDLGEYRLRDLSQPERVFQLCHPSLVRTFPPLLSLDRFPTNLPGQETLFVGRDGEMGEVAEILGEARLLTLTGVGGVGKTRLAIQSGAELLPRYPDGVWVVELGGIAEASALDDALAAVLAVRPQTGQTLAQSVLSFLSNKRLLLVLDNCEHLLEPVARLVESILRVSKEVAVLATGREALRVAGERVMTVPSLAVPDLDTDAEELASADAVHLFVERARSVRSGFAITPDNAGAVAQLCRRLDGIPLAIELAAARVGSMTPNEIAARLDQRFRLLTGGSRTASSRHQTLRRAIDWSYELMEPPERALLGRLAVCAGGFDLAAAESIGAGGLIDALDVDDLVCRLVDKSLLVAHDLGDRMRYRMLETIREYAFEQLAASGEVERVRTRHADHYSHFAAEAGAGLKGPDERRWLERVEDELDNLRAAVTWTLDRGEPGPAVTCVGALGLQGLRIEPAVSSWAEAIVACPQARDDPGFPAAQAVLAWMKIREGRAEEARQLRDVALEGLDRLAERAAYACRVFSPLAAMQPYFGQNPIVTARRWLDAAQADGDAYETALAMTMVSVGQVMDGDATATETAEAAVRAARLCGSPSAIAYSLFCLAQTLSEDDRQRALQLLDESRQQAESAANDYASNVAGAVRSFVLSRAGDFEAAAWAFLDVGRRAARDGRRDTLAVQLFMVAGCLAAEGFIEPAATLWGYTEALLGPQDPFAVLNLADEAKQALAHLSAELGPDPLGSLKAKGGLMSDDEALRYAESQLMRLGPSKTGRPAG
jgi:predicted ATPase/class 3 adenylate cyclase